MSPELPHRPSPRTIPIEKPAVLRSEPKNEPARTSTPEWALGERRPESDLAVASTLI